jgi:predicted nucleic acid-binding protein
MILVDSSVWVEFFRGRDLALVSRLYEALDGDDIVLAAPVRLEILTGARRSELGTLRRVFSALPVQYPTTETWQMLDGWTVEARERGLRFGAMDLLIAGIAAEAHATLWSKDSAFRSMAKLGWLTLCE